MLDAASVSLSGFSLGSDTIRAERSFKDFPYENLVGNYGFSLWEIARTKFCIQFWGSQTSCWRSWCQNPTQHSTEPPP